MESIGKYRKVKGRKVKGRKVFTGKYRTIKRGKKLSSRCSASNNTDVAQPTSTYKHDDHISPFLLLLITTR
eukprot:10220391-Prorocentrum_lima.AAC.1